jgi:hypothetical protein
MVLLPGVGWVAVRDGSRASTVRSIVENPRYTGCAVFGRWTEHEVLLDPNWFTLGGVITLQAPEAALNRGKSWAMAAPMYFRGQKVSFMSEDAPQITSYARLEELFVEHLTWMQQHLRRPVCVPDAPTPEPRTGD